MMIHARDDYNRIQDPAGLIGEDEPVFLLRAKDRTAPTTIRAWAKEQRKLPDHDKEAVNLALRHAYAMEAWQAINCCKTADVGRLTSRAPETMSETIEKLELIARHLRSDAAEHENTVHDYRRMNEETAEEIDAIIKEMREPSFGFSPMWLAPIDGTPVLLYMPTTHDKYAIGAWRDDAWRDEDDARYVHEPAGWMALHVLDKLRLKAGITGYTSPTADKLAEALRKKCGQWRRLATDEFRGDRAIHSFADDIESVIAAHEKGATDSTSTDRSEP